MTELITAPNQTEIIDIRYVKRECKDRQNLEPDCSSIIDVSLRATSNNGGGNKWRKCLRPQGNHSRPSTVFVMRWCLLEIFLNNITDSK